MRRTLKATGVLFALAVLYLTLWPVPIDPVAWQAPRDLGYVDPFERNDLLGPARGIDLGDFHGPEDATVGRDGHLYVTVDGGAIIRIRNRQVELFASPGGRPLGIETDEDGSLVVANAIDGLQRIAADGSVTTILDKINTMPLVNANNLAIGPQGIIYFSRSSSKFTTDGFGGSYQASLLDILEHGGHGSVVSFNPATGDTDTLLTDINYANGVAISDDGSFLLVAETGHYRVLKYWLQGDKRGSSEVLIDNLPGFPDNIKSGKNGRFWLGLAAPRNQLVDKMSDKPLLRKMVQRLPEAVRPKAVPSSHVIAINGEGEVLMNLHDASARYPTLTGVLETSNSLFLTSLFGNQLARLAKSDLLN